MKIIKKGTPPEEREYKLTCTNCTTVFQFYRKEAKLTSDDRNGSYLDIACPICGKICTAREDSYIKPLEDNNWGNNWR